jgi:glycosyltransferase involved in cell wall biosynthesis
LQSPGRRSESSARGWRSAIDADSGRERIMMVRFPTRVLICATELPPFHGGGAQSLVRLLRDVDPDDYVLAGFGPALPVITSGLPELPTAVRRLPSDWRPPSPKDRYRLSAVRSLRRFGLETARRSGHLTRLLETEGFGALLVVTGPTPDVPASWIASRLTGTPLIIYMLDDWRHLIAMLNPWLGVGASLLESVILPRTDRVIVLSPLLAEELQSQGHHAEVVGIPLPSGAELRPDGPERPWPRDPDQVRLVFTGQVYAAHYDALETVLRAIEMPGLEKVTLHLYCQASADELDRVGLRGRLVLHEFVPPPDIYAIQRDADILLMALGFTTPYPDIVRTAVSTKTGEYLASDCPILVYAPPSTFAAVLARTDGVGALVDTPDPAVVASAIRRIIGDPEHRHELVQAQRAAVLRYHSPEATTKRLSDVVGNVMRRRSRLPVAGLGLVRKVMAMARTS